MLKHITQLSLIALMLGWVSLSAAPKIQLLDTTFAFESAADASYSFKPEGKTTAETLTLVYDPEVRSSSKLEAYTNGFRDEFKEGGQLLKAQRARSPDGAMLGYLLVAIFKTDTGTQAKMARVTQNSNGGIAMIYEQRFAGENAEKDMIAWFQAHGRKMEQALLNYDPLPEQPDFAKADPAKKE